MKKQRLDVALVERGLCDTRSKAQSLIMARRILVNGKHVDKAGANVANDDELRIEELEHPWVGRGGIKLAHALREFGISVEGKICADIGASTGGPASAREGPRRGQARAQSARSRHDSLCVLVRSGLSG